MTYLPKQQQPGKGSGKAAKGFTLIELMLVVLLLGILASVVLAAVGNPTGQAKQTALALTLRQFRGQLRVYILQHQAALPTDGPTLADVLLHKTDVAGNVGTGGPHTLGPYLVTFPANPYNGRSDVKVVPAGANLTPDGSTGWIYQVDDGNFAIVANTLGTTQEGKAIASY